MYDYSSRRINALLNSFSAPTRYLEIGVETGQTFFAVTSPQKTAVDPTFTFDLDEAQSAEPTSHFFQITSDDYFQNHWDGQPFDIMFLDGLHTWDQTYRDFCNSLLAMHKRSVIILDDVFPNDVFSCNRDQVEAVMMRQFMTNDPSNAWHGDTYKVIPLIRTFHPLLNFCTIITDGNPQALVWRSPKASLPSPILSDVGSLNMPALDYLWFLRNQESYNLMNEEDALALVIDSINRG
jgi:hypothetical protein